MTVWTIILFSYALVQVAAAVAITLDEFWVIRIPVYMQSAFLAPACWMTPFAFLAAATNALFHFQSEPRARGTWMVVGALVIILVAAVEVAWVGAVYD